MRCLVAEEDVAERLEVELHCPECGARGRRRRLGPVRALRLLRARCSPAGACSARRCSSVKDATATALDVVAAPDPHRDRELPQRAGRTLAQQEGLQLDLPTADRRARRAVSRQARGGARAGRRRGLPGALRAARARRRAGRARTSRPSSKESFVQCFLTEDLRRRFDATKTNLRDRGLKIRGAKLALLSDAHRDSVEDRFLDTADADTETRRRRSRTARARESTATRRWSRRSRACCASGKLEIWKHMSVGRVRRAGVVEDYLIDHQFDTIAGRLAGDEAARAPRARTAPARRGDREAEPARARVGVPELRRRSRTPAARRRSPSAGTARWASAIAPEGLRAVRLRAGRAPAARKGPDGVHRLPVLVAAVPPARGRARVDARLGLARGGLDAARRDALPRAGPGREPPLRSGARDLRRARARRRVLRAHRDRHLAPAARCAVERASPADALRICSTSSSSRRTPATLARYALVALHDAQSTRSLNGMNFRSLVRDVELVRGRARARGPAARAPRRTLGPLPGRGRREPGRRLGRHASGAAGVLEDDGRRRRASRAPSRSP